MFKKPKTPRERLNSAVRRCIPGAVLALGYSFIISLSMLIPPLYMIQIFDRVLSSRSLGTLFGLTVLAFLGVFVYSVFEFLRSRSYSVLGTWLGKRLSDDLMEPILSQSLRGAGAPSQTLRDVGELKNFVMSGSMTAGLELIWSPLFILVLWLIHPAFGIVTVIGAFVLTLFAVINEMVTRHPTLEASSRATQAYNQIGEALRNAESIEAMGILPRVIRKWRAADNETSYYVETATRRGDLIKSITQGIRLGVQMLLFAVAAILIIKNEVSAGVLLAVAMIAIRALAPIESLISGWKTWLHAWSAFKRLVSVAEDYQRNPRSGTALPRPKGLLEYDRVVFAPPGYPKAVIKGISLTVEPGELIALVGPSAAGKSTLARLTVGIWPASSGAVRLDGHDVYQWDRENFGEYVGYLPQAVELFSGTVKENIARLQDAPIERVIEAAKKAGVHEAIGKMANGYETKIGPGGFSLTGGQRQRLALARALFGNPALIVLDEPDASLDTDGQGALAAALIAEREKGKTIMVVTHRPNLLRIVDKIVVMNEGQVVKVTTPDSVAPQEYDDARPAETAKALEAIRKVEGP